MSEPVMRVGDRERGEVDALLRDALSDGVLTLTEYDERAALCWAARTRPELDDVVRDLPGAAVQLPVPRSSGPVRVLAVLGESGLEQPPGPGRDVQATAVMGTAEVDLRRDDLPRELTVRATAVLGEVKVHVPQGTTVHLTGQAVMGERKVKLGAPAAGGTVVHVVANAVMGTVKVDDKPRKGGLLPAVVERIRTGSRPVEHVPHTAAVTHTGHRPGVLAKVAGAVVPLAALSALGFGAVQVLGADDGAAVFGSRTVSVQEGDDRVEVGMAFGSVRVVVPDDVRVRTSGVVVFGSTTCRDACTGTGDAVEVRGTGAFGSIEVLTQAEAARDDRDGG